MSVLCQVYEQMITQIEEETGTLPEELPRGVGAEAAAANSDVQGIIAPRLNVLMEIANSFLSTIIETLESVPYGIRWICKQIRSLTKVHQAGVPVSDGILTCGSSVNTRMRTMAPSVRSSAVSSSCGSSTQPSLRHKRTCWWRVSRPSTRGEHSPW
jgi:hypothetical protein